jgi:enolase
VQELLVTHVDVSPIECIKNNIIVYHELESLLKQRNMFFAKNDEGAISTNISFRDALYLIEESKKNLKLIQKEEWMLPQILLQAAN